LRIESQCIWSADLIFSRLIMHFPSRLPATLGSTSAFEVRVYITENPEFAVALSVDGMVGVTWNRSEGRPSGFPHTYSHQQWFILPDPLARMVLAGVDFIADQAR